MVDIGTNNEISMVHKGKVYSCSTASGPAFEGAHIRHGMRAASGAIERVQISEGQVHVYTIDHQPAVGICGSGILDALAEMQIAGIVNEKGALKKDHPLVHMNGNHPEFMLVPPEKTQIQKAISLTRPWYTPAGSRVASPSCRASPALQASSASAVVVGEKTFRPSVPAAA